MSSERTDAPESDAAVELTGETDYWPAVNADDVDPAQLQDEDKVLKPAGSVKLYEAAELNQNYNVELMQGGTELNLGFRVQNKHDETDHEVIDPESGEKGRVYFVIVTTKNAAGDLKLAKTLISVRKAKLWTRTCDAKSGSPHRITSLGCSDERLLAFADAIGFERKFDAAKIEAACVEKGLILENPDSFEGRYWYPPYENLTAPYNTRTEAMADLYMPLTDGERLKIFRLLLTQDTHFHGDGKGCGFDIGKLESTVDDNDSVLAVYALHKEELRASLEAQWMPFDWPWNLPVSKIEDYFGEEISFYFAFLGHLTTGLIPLGLGSVVFQYYATQEIIAGDRLHAPAIFVALSIVYYVALLDSWNYRQSALAQRWCCFNADLTMPPRAGFDGIIMKDPITGNLDVIFPSYAQATRFAATAVVTSGMACVLVLTVVSIFLYRASIVRAGTEGVMLFVPSVLNSIQVTVYGLIYRKIAEVLTEFENHKTTLAHNSNLFRKLTAFYFVNNFGTLIYIAFIKGSMEGCKDAFTGSPSCGMELTMQVASLFFLNDFMTRIAKSLILPKLNTIAKLYFMDRDLTTDSSRMSAAESQFQLLSRYDPTDELVMDYIELYVQWGYLTLFGSAFPVSVALAALTDFIETRTDGYKLLTSCRRVLPNRVSGIGEPLKVLQSTLVLAVPVNAALIVYTYKAFDDYISPASRTWMFMLIVGFLYVTLHYMVLVLPDVPRKTEVQLGRSKVVYDRVVLEYESTEDLVSFTPEMLGMPIAKAKKVMQANSNRRYSIIEAEGEVVSVSDFTGAPYTGTSLDDEGSSPMHENEEGSPI